MPLKMCAILLALFVLANNLALAGDSVVHGLYDDSPGEALHHGDHRAAADPMDAQDCKDDHHRCHTHMPGFHLGGQPGWSIPGFRQAWRPSLPSVTLSRDNRPPVPPPDFSVL
ncbi:MAG: hypothetical protein WC247_06475 [Porticoccaceae bacterium]